MTSIEDISEDCGGREKKSCSYMRITKLDVRRTQEKIFLFLGLACAGAEVVLDRRDKTEIEEK